MHTVSIQTLQCQELFYSTLLFKIINESFSFHLLQLSTKLLNS